tara:strand:+ start:4317 stop:5381 length:1065 start_codon:yes stop_codon:yes gene_type:complete
MRALYLLPTLLFLVPETATTIRFEPKADVSVTKTFTQKADLEASAVEITLSGMEDDPAIDLSMSWERSHAFTDTYLSSADGKATKLRRKFGDLEHEIQGELAVESMGFNGEESSHAAGESALTGKAVTFTRDADDADAVEVAWVEGEGGPDELLEGLLVDTDLLGFLPTKDVAVGDSWDVPGDALVRLLVPGGASATELESDGDEASLEMTIVGLNLVFLSQFEETVGESQSCDATATFTGEREVDGVRMAVLKLDVELETARDVSEVMRAFLENLDDEDVTAELTGCDMTVALEATGELLWNLDAGHVHGLDLKGDLRIEMERGVEVDAQGQEITVDLILELEGELTLTLTVE